LPPRPLHHFPLARGVWELPWFNVHGHQEFGIWGVLTLSYNAWLCKVQPRLLGQHRRLGLGCTTGVCPLHDHCSRRCADLSTGEEVSNPLWRCTPHQTSTAARETRPAGSAALWQRLRSSQFDLVVAVGVLSPRAWGLRRRGECSENFLVLLEGSLDMALPGSDMEWPGWPDIMRKWFMSWWTSRVILGGSNHGNCVARDSWQGI